MHFIILPTGEKLGQRFTLEISICVHVFDLPLRHASRAASKCEHIAVTVRKVTLARACQFQHPGRLLPSPRHTLVDVLAGRPDDGLDAESVLPACTCVLICVSVNDLRGNNCLCAEIGLYHFEPHRCDFTLAQGR